MGRRLARGAAALSAVIFGLTTAEARAAERELYSAGACDASVREPDATPLLPERLADHLPRELHPLVREPETYRLQILVGQIVERPGKPPCLVQEGYRADAEYFYPASSIKLFAALAALQSIPGEPWQAPADLDTPLAFHAPSRGDFGRKAAGGDGLAALEEAPFRPRQEGTLAELIASSLVVSSNRAYNRVFDVAGFGALNRSMWAAGLESARLRHRLFSPRSRDQERWSPEIRAARGHAARTDSARTGDESELLLAERSSDLELPPPGIPRTRVGSSHIAGGEVRDGPMDFSDFNYLSLRDHQRAMVALYRPGATDVAFAGLAPHERDYLQALAEMDPVAFAEARGLDLGDDPVRRFKPGLPGVADVVPRARVRYANKGGRAYGFHVENAYIAREDTGEAVFFTAVAYVNENRRVNDNDYEYDELSFPLFRELGALLARRALGG